MNFSQLALCASLLSVLSVPVVFAADMPLLAAQTPVVVPGGPGGFDWMTVDAPRHRLLATHPGKGTLVVYDLKMGIVQQLETEGKVNGEAIDEADNKLFVAGGNQKVVVFDLKTLTKTGTISLTGPGDSIVFDPKNDTLYVDHDDASEVWVINAKTEKITGTVAVAGAPEAIVYDPATDRLYQNIKPANCTQVIDPARNVVEATWPTAPMTSPHGLAIDDASHRLFSAGQGKVVVLDMNSGKVVSRVDIAPGYVDQIAFDAPTKRVYCASSVGAVSVIGETADGATLLGTITVPKGTHTLAVDPETHDVWISYSDATNANLMRLTAAK